MHTHSGAESLPFQCLNTDGGKIAQRRVLLWAGIRQYTCKVPDPGAAKDIVGEGSNKGNPTLPQPRLLCPALAHGHPSAPEGRAGFGPQATVRLESTSLQGAENHSHPSLTSFRWCFMNSTEREKNTQTRLLLQGLLRKQKRGRERQILYWKIRPRTLEKGKD